MSRFTEEEQERFRKGLEDINLDSDSELEESFHENQKMRLQLEIQKLRQAKPNQILDELKKNVAGEEAIMEEFQTDIQELQKITKNQSMNVIDEKLIHQIKIKVAENNNSVLQLAEQTYHQSAAFDEVDNTSSQSVFKKQNKLHDSKRQELCKEQILLSNKIAAANAEREWLNIEREDKLSMQYQMQVLSQFFSERYLQLNIPKIQQKDCKIEMVSSKLRSTFTNLRPLPNTEEYILPRNAPEIALKHLKRGKKIGLKPKSISQVKVTCKKFANPEEFEVVDRDLQVGRCESKNDQLQKMIIRYIKSVSDKIKQIEEISRSYKPKFIRHHLDASEKNVNFEFQQTQIVGKEKLLQQVASIENASALREIKLTFQEITNLKGIQNFYNIQYAELQFNAISKLESIEKCAKLIELNLSSNKLKNIGSLSSLAWLRFINLQQNYLKNLNIYCPSLQILYAGHNFIEDFDLSGSRHLRILRINNNKINEMKPMNLYYLEQFDLSKNLLRKLQNIESLVLLKNLNVSFNRLETLNEPFIYLHLNQLNMVSNYLATLPTIILPCLEKLYLSNNKLSASNDKQIYLPNLKELNLDQNKLQGFTLVWQLLRFSPSLQILKYNNNQYFLSVREKVQELYEFLIYRNMNNLKILNQADLDVGLKKYYQQHYQCYLKQIQMFRTTGPILKHLETHIRFILKEMNLSERVQKRSKFAERKQFVVYKSVGKANNLISIIQFAKKFQSDAQHLITSNCSIFYYFDRFQNTKRLSYQKISSLIIAKKYKTAKRKKYFLSKKNQIKSALQFTNNLLRIVQIKTIIQKFDSFRKTLSQDQAAIKIQKIWRGYMRRKIYKKIKNRKVNDLDEDLSDIEDFDTDFFEKPLEKYEFDLEMEELNIENDIIIRPEVFQFLRNQQNKQKQRKNKITNPKMIDNYVQEEKIIEKPQKKIVNNGPSEEQKLMKEWHLKDDKLLKTLQYRKYKKDEMKRKQIEKNLTPAERYQRFKKANK